MGRILAGAFAMAVLTLTGVAAMFVFTLARPDRPLPDLSPAILAIAGIGCLIALASNFVSNAMGRRAAREWAAAGRSGSDVATSPPMQTTRVFGLDVGPTAQPAGGNALWDRFTTATIVGCAMAETAGLEAFVAAIVSHRFSIMLLGLGVSGTFLFLNFPRRATWDTWADEAGLKLPWSQH